MRVTGTRMAVSLRLPSCSLLLLLALGAVVHSLPTVLAADAPVKRKIVGNLSEELSQQLKENGISLLLVLPGARNPNDTSLNWDGIAKGLQHVEYIRSFADFSSHWHRSSRSPSPVPHEHTRLRGPRRARNLLRRLMGALADGQPQGHNQQQQHHVQRGSVALLTLGENGSIRSGQANLAAALQRRLRGAIGLTLTFSTHKDKPETLVTFDKEGEPVLLAVQESSVFRDAFTKIYDQKIWSTAGGGSGLGSTLKYTAKVRSQLLDVLSRYKVKSMLDSSCGSMHWMPLVLRQHQKQQAGFKFMGTDVVCSLITRHKTTFANETNWNFQCVDYSAQPLPSGYELVWSRDSLQHIPMHGAWQFLNNVKASGAKYLLVGSYVKSTAPNRDIGGGDYYDIDLLKPPFSASKPLEIIDEQTPDGKHILLFDVASMTWSDPLYGLV